MNHLQRGSYAEDLAASYLTRHGLRLIHRNFRCRLGEIDLIMQDHDTLVFVEVRMRSRTEHGSPAQSITKTKQRRLILAALCYLQGPGKRFQRHFQRFDVILQNAQHKIDWIKNAFEVQY